MVSLVFLKVWKNKHRNLWTVFWFPLLNVQNHSSRDLYNLISPPPCCMQHLLNNPMIPLSLHPIISLNIILMIVISWLSLHFINMIILLSLHPIIPICRAPTSRRACWSCEAAKPGDVLHHLLPVYSVISYLRYKLYSTWLAVLTILKNMKVNGKDCPIYSAKQKMFETTNQI